MNYQSLPDVIKAWKGPLDQLLVEKQGLKVWFAVKEREFSYEISDIHGGVYLIGKQTDSVAWLPIWRAISHYL